MSSSRRRGSLSLAAGLTRAVPFGLDEHTTPDLLPPTTILLLRRVSFTFRKARMIPEILLCEMLELIARSSTKALI